MTCEKIPSGSVFNIGGSYTTTVKDILEKLISKSKIKEISHFPDPERMRPIDADLQIPDTSKFKSFTNWEPIIPYEKTINDLLNYWRDLISKNGNSFLQR